MQEDNEWELCKENIQPLKSGRRMESLKQALKSDQAYLEEQIQEFEMKLRNTKGEEQLLVWDSYIKFMEQQSVRDRTRIKLMRRCIETLDKTMFKENEVYLKIWLNLGEMMDDPPLIFDYMMDQDIGTGYALFYIRWAELFELFGARKKADELYTLGINRNAQPVEILLESKKNFEVRIMKKVAENSTAINEIPTRKILGNLKVSKNGKVASDRTKIKANHGGLKEQTKSSSKSGFSIYGDENPTPVFATASSNQMRTLPTQLSHQENIKPMETLKGTKVKHAGGKLSVKSKFDIYNEQSEDQIDHPTPKQVVLSARKPLSRRKTTENPYEMENLNKPRISDDSSVVVKYWKSKIYMGVREVSFEELKFQLPKYQSRRLKAGNARSKLIFNQNDIEMDDTSEEGYLMDQPSQKQKHDFEPISNDDSKENNFDITEIQPINENCLEELSSNATNHVGLPKYESTAFIKKPETDVVMATPGKPSPEKLLEELNNTKRIQYVESKENMLAELEQTSIIPNITGTFTNTQVDNQRFRYSGNENRQIVDRDIAPSTNTKNLVGFPKFESTAFIKKPEINVVMATPGTPSLEKPLEEFNNVKVTHSGETKENLQTKVKQISVIPTADIFPNPQVENQSHCDSDNANKQIVEREAKPPDNTVSAPGKSQTDDSFCGQINNFPEFLGKEIKYNSGNEKTQTLCRNKQKNKVEDTIHKEIGNSLFQDPVTHQNEDSFFSQDNDLPDFLKEVEKNNEFTSNSVLTSSVNRDIFSDNPLPNLEKPLNYQNVVSQEKCTSETIFTPKMNPFSAVCVVADVNSKNDSLTTQLGNLGLGLSGSQTPIGNLRIEQADNKIYRNDNTEPTLVSTSKLCSSHIDGKPTDARVDLKTLEIPPSVDSEFDDVQMLANEAEDSFFAENNQNINSDPVQKMQVTKHTPMHVKRRDQGLIKASNSTHNTSRNEFLFQQAVLSKTPKTKYNQWVSDNFENNPSNEFNQNQPSQQLWAPSPTVNTHLTQPLWAPSPTVHTKKAMASVEQWFGDSLDQEKFSVSLEDEPLEKCQIEFEKQFGFAKVPQKQGFHYISRLNRASRELRSLVGVQVSRPPTDSEMIQKKSITGNTSFQVLPTTLPSGHTTKPPFQIFKDTDDTKKENNSNKVNMLSCANQTGLAVHQESKLKIIENDNLQRSSVNSFNENISLRTFELNQTSDMIQSTDGSAFTKLPQSRSQSRYRLKSQGFQIYSDPPQQINPLTKSSVIQQQQPPKSFEIHSDSTEQLNSFKEQATNSTQQHKRLPIDSTQHALDSNVISHRGLSDGDPLQESAYLLFHSDNTATQPFSSTAFSKSYPQMNINLSNINTEQASRSSNATMMTSNQNLSVIEERSNENENTSHTKHELLVNPFDENFITNCVERILNTVRKSQFYLRFTGPLPKLQGTTELDLGPKNLQVKKILCKENSSATYKAFNEHNKLVSLKIARNDPSLLWDFYISKEIERRLRVIQAPYVNMHRNYIRHDSVIEFSDSVCLETPYYNEGTLEAFIRKNAILAMFPCSPLPSEVGMGTLEFFKKERDLVNLYKKHDRKMDETLCLKYTHEILSIIVTLHRLHILHMKIRPNVFLQADSQLLNENGPLALRCFTLKDFQQSIDLRLISDGDDTMFCGSNNSDAYECQEMRENERWKFQVDYFAAAATIHAMVFQNSMNTYIDTETSRLAIAKRPPSNWDDTLWSTIFSTLINAKDDSLIIPLIDRIANILEQPHAVQRLQDAILYKNDLLIDDD